MVCFKTIIEQAARMGGEVIRNNIKGRLTVRQKDNFDFVTNSDVASEDAIRKILQKEFPDFDFIGEESTYGGDASERSMLEALPEEGYAWIVDPLDGTTNFIRGIPQFCVSIALAQGKRLIAGAVYDVSADEMFSAEVGKGAFLNGKRIWVSRPQCTKDMIIGMAFPAARIDERGKVLEMLERMSREIGSVRIYNCAALMMCYVACGRLDASFERGIHIWDIAAGTVLIREAGGEVLRCDGSPFDLYSREQLSGNAQTLTQLGAIWGWAEAR